MSQVIDKVYTYMLFLLGLNYFQYYVQCEIKCNLLFVMMMAGTMEDLIHITPVLKCPTPSCNKCP